jgi:two-component system NtrC family sensor kinase
MHGIRVRLNVLFVVIVTLVLTISGGYSQFKLNRELEDRYAQLRLGVVTRLQISLPSALWDLDKTKVGSILEAEMLPPDVLAIRVFDASVGMFAGKLRNSDGILVNSSADAKIAGTVVEAPLTFRGNGGENGILKAMPVGRVVINFNRDQIDATLRAALTRKVIEIILLDVILTLALSLSLHMVFEPLRQLRDGMFELANSETQEVQELPTHSRDEFGEVIDGFNRIQRKLKSIIEHIRKAEEAAQKSQQETVQAYEDLRQAQNSLLQAERLASLGALVAGVAHEINTPVGITLTSASVLHDATVAIQATVAGGGIKKSDILSYLSTASESSRLILSNADRAAHLIQSFKQIAVDQTSEARRRFDLKQYIDEVIMSLSPRLRQTRVKVEVDCPIDLAIDSYPGAFAQMLTNLTMNALTHAFDNMNEGEIAIKVEVSQGWVILQFADNGKGIVKEHLDKIFDPFFTTKRSHGGTGLGLNIVYNLVVKQFGGTIVVDSELGKGAQFTVRFPQVAPKQELV